MLAELVHFENFVQREAFAIVCASAAAHWDSYMHVNGGLVRGVHVSDQQSVAMYYCVS